MVQPNHPDLWLSLFPRPAAEGHKYARGHCVVIGGAVLTGAARLAAEGAARIGAGLVTLVAPADIAPVYRAACAPHIMVEDELADRCSQLQDPRRNALVLGPGFGADAGGVLAWLAARGPQRLVLDADGLNALAARPAGMAHLRQGDVLTPHAGEYARLFGDADPADAARKTGAVLVVKGAVTRITDGTRMVASDHASPYLASAGTGDVLAGMIGGLLAQGMDVFEAACAAVWLHGEAGLRIGAGLVASDIPDVLPEVLKALLAGQADGGIGLPAPSSR